MAAEVQALAFVYNGDWVANCPRPGCTNTEFLSPNQWQFFCGSYARARGQSLESYCQWTGPVGWPGNAYEIHTELARRPVKFTRHWYPKDHPIAVAGHAPHGQSVKHLADEFAENDPIAAKER